MQMRHKAKRDARYFVRQDGELGDMTVGELRELAQGEIEALSRKVNRRAARLRGTPQYWAQRGNELGTMISDPHIGCPQLFFTLTAADMQWDDLHSLIAAYEGYVLLPDDATEQQRQHRRKKDLNDNPVLVAWYLERRVALFIKKFVTPLYGVTDSWYRWECRVRGSGHVHGFLWLRKAPQCKSTAPRVDQLDFTDEKDRTRFEGFWGRVITAINPGKDVPPANQHPSSLPHSARSFTKKEVAELINRVQRHLTCTEGYCLRKPKGWKEGQSLEVRAVLSHGETQRS
jgi:Helitron helicase-like domain at N-terminus